MEPPSDADIASVLQKISHRVIRTLRRLGYLEAGIDVAVATGYDPLLDNEPELARSMAAPVRQRIASGERAGEKVRRIGSGFGYEGERPALTGPRCDAGLPAIRYHDARHTVATLLLELNTHPAIVQWVLGHSSIQTTLDIYSHVTTEATLQATSALAKALRQRM